jgi:pimeloyl-ACP methyl ester carboxylesterase
MATEDQVGADKKGRMLKTSFRSDLLYWVIATLFKRQLMSLMGADKTVIAGLKPEQRRIVELVIEYMNPASALSAGVAFDNVAVLPGARIAAIEVPTLIVHARDDTLQLYHNAEFAASTIPDTQLIRFEHGGHLVMVVGQVPIRTSLRDHILDHLEEAG